MYQNRVPFALLARLAAQHGYALSGPPVSAGDYDVVAGGTYDIISGADEIDPDAQELLAAGYDADLVGAEMIAGGEEIDPEDIEIGAVRPAPRRRPVVLRRSRGLPFLPNPRNMSAASVARSVRMAKAYQAQPVIIEKPYTKTRKLPMPIDSGAEVPAGGAQTITLFSNGPYKPELLIIPDDIAADFVITTIQFGRVNGLGAAGEMPCSSYTAESAEQNTFEVDAISPGNPIQIGVRNISGAARRFRGRFQGEMLES